MPNYTTKDSRGSSYATFGIGGPAKTGATSKRGGMGHDSSNNPNLIDDAGNVVLSTGTNAVVIDGTLTAANGLAVTGLFTAGAATVSAAGSAIGNATALSSNVNWVNGADGAKGVRLPSGAGNFICIYNNHATAGLNVYPPVNGTLDGGSANAALVQEGNTISFFISIANGDYRRMNAFTANS